MSFSVETYFALPVCFPNFLWILFISLNYLFSYFYYWPHWVFATVRGLSLVAASGGYLIVWASHCGGFSCWWAQVLKLMGSVVVAQGLNCPVACGIFLDQRSNLCLLLWQADPFAYSPSKAWGSYSYGFFSPLLTDGSEHSVYSLCRGQRGVSNGLCSLRTDRWREPPKCMPPITWVIPTYWKPRKADENEDFHCLVN